MIAKALNVLTIVRSAWYCPANFEATEYTNTAFSFLSWDKISMYVVAENDQDIKDEIERKANDDEVVHNTGDEEVDWVKNFLKFPISPSSAPTSDYQFTNKKYIDDKLALVGDKFVLTDTKFLAWEDLLKGDILYLKAVDNKLYKASALTYDTLPKWRIRICASDTLSWNIVRFDFLWDTKLFSWLTQWEKILSFWHGLTYFNNALNYCVLNWWRNWNRYFENMNFI